MSSPDTSVNNDGGDTTKLYDPIARTSKKGELLGTEERLYQTHFNWEEQRRSIFAMVEAANRKLQHFEREVNTGRMVMAPTIDEFFKEAKLQIPAEQLTDPAAKANLTEYRTVKERLSNDKYWKSDKIPEVLKGVAKKFFGVEDTIKESQINTRELSLQPLRHMLHVLNQEINDTTIEGVLAPSNQQLQQLTATFDATEWPKVDEYSERETANFLKRQRDRILGDDPMDLLTSAYAPDDSLATGKKKKKKLTKLTQPADNPRMWENEWWFRSREALEKSMESLVQSEGIPVLQTLRSLSENAVQVTEVLKGQLALINAMDSDLDLHKPSVESLLTFEDSCAKLMNEKIDLKSACHDELRHLRKEILTFDTELKSWDDRFLAFKQESDDKLRLNEENQAKHWQTILETQRKLDELMEERYKEVQKRVEMNDRHLLRHGWTVHTREMSLSHEDAIQATMNCCNTTIDYIQESLSAAQAISNLTVLMHDKKKSKVIVERERCEGEWSRIFHTVMSLWVDIGTKLARQKSRYVEELNNVETHAKNQLTFYKDTSDPHERNTHLAISIIREMRREQVTQIRELYSHASDVLEKLAPKHLHLYMRKQAEQLLTEVEGIVQKAEKADKEATEHQIPPSRAHQKRNAPKSKSSVIAEEGEEEEMEREEAQEKLMLDPIAKDFSPAAQHAAYYPTGARPQRPSSAPGWVSKAAHSPHSPAAKQATVAREDDTARLPANKKMASKWGEDQLARSGLPQLRPSTAPHSRGAMDTPTKRAQGQAGHTAVDGSKSVTSPSPLSSVGSAAALKSTPPRHPSSSASSPATTPPAALGETYIPEIEEAAMPSVYNKLYNPEASTPSSTKKKSRQLASVSSPAHVHNDREDFADPLPLSEESTNAAKPAIPARPHSAAAAAPIPNSGGSSTPPADSAMPSIPPRPASAAASTLRSSLSPALTRPSSAPAPGASAKKRQHHQAGNLTSKYRALYDEFYAPIQPYNHTSLTNYDTESRPQSSILGISKPLVALYFNSPKENDTLDLMSGLDDEPEEGDAEKKKKSAFYKSQPKPALPLEKFNHQGPEPEGEPTDNALFQEV
eukprot:TRINITY_DN62622_c0_g1_i1.p1 TRINITY_DN62622_c0_g1~~TRINITY_DN62622_c0_g1_i1.p1  ORF type:complete len:1082 (-),score=120.21 TRINITY_DN62622_c0_g1_i1:11-3256(-)